MLRRNILPLSPGWICVVWMLIILETTETYLFLQASLSKCHFKWWGMRKKPLPPYMIFCEPTGIRGGKKGWWSRWMKFHVVWQRGIVRYKPDAFILYPDGGRKSLSNTDTSLPDYMAWHNKECNFCQTVNSHKMRYFTSITFIISSGQSSQGVCHVSIRIVFVVRIPKVSIWTPAPSSAIWLMGVVFCSQQTDHFFHLCNHQWGAPVSKVCIIWVANCLTDVWKCRINRFLFKLYVLIGKYNSNKIFFARYCIAHSIDYWQQQ